jgi:mRNA interferase RelE/StbE
VSAALRYTVLIKRPAEREMDALHPEIFRRVTRAILALETDPRGHGSKKLRGKEAYSRRVGRYRIVYTIDDDAREVEVVAVGHRREVYR